MVRCIIGCSPNPCLQNKKTQFWNTDRDMVSTGLNGQVSIDVSDFWEHASWWVANESFQSDCTLGPQDFKSEWVRLLKPCQGKVSGKVQSSKLLGHFFVNQQWLWPIVVILHSCSPWSASCRWWRVESYDVGWACMIWMVSLAQLRHWWTSLHFGLRQQCAA